MKLLNPHVLLARVELFSACPCKPLAKAAVGSHSERRAGLGSTGGGRTNGCMKEQ